MKRTVKAIYLNDSYSAEEEILQACGVETLRFPLEDVISESPPDTLPRSSFVIARGPRLSDSDYGRMDQRLRQVDSELYGTPAFRSFLGNPSEVWRALSDLSPRGGVAEISTDTEGLLDVIKQAGMRFPIFLRSDKESAAKYVGVEGCLINDDNGNSAATALQNLRAHVQGAKQILLKEVWPIAKDKGEPIELRAVVLGEQVVCWDADPEVRQSSFFSTIAQAARTAAQRLCGAGGRGAYFIDFAMSDDDRAFVVELKDLTNGTIKHPKSFGEGLRSIDL